MSNDWIKMRVDLDTDTDVIGISAELGISETYVVGLLHKFWSWANKNTSTGTLHRTSPAWIDRFVSCSGFSEALVRVGWLVVRHNSLILPEWDRHNGSSAKSRACDAIRKKGERDSQKNIEVTPKSRNPEKSGQNSDICPENVQKNPDEIRTRERVREEKDKNNIPTTNACAREESKIVAANSGFSPPTDEPQPYQEPVGDREWLGTLKHNYPDRDVEGELKSFQNYCQKKGTAANRNGFVGWLRKASPTIQAIQQPKPLYSY